MADYGLLGGLGEGLKAAAQGFGQGFEMRNQAEARKQALADAIKARKLAAFEKGVTEDESGEYKLTPEAIAKNEKKEALDSAEKGLKLEIDPMTSKPKYVFDPSSAKGEMQKLKSEYDQKLADKKTQDALNDPMKQFAFDYKKNQIEKQNREEQGLLEPKEAQKELINYEKASAANVSNSKTFKRVDEILGFNLDDYDESIGGIRKIDPKTGQETIQKIDVPGVSIMGAGRFFPGDRAQAFKSAAVALFNPILKERSGATVVDSELERLKEEFSQGKFATEEQMMGALKRARQIAVEHAQRLDQAFGPQIMDLAKNRGLKTSDIYYASNFGTSPEQVAASRQNQIPQKGLLKDKSTGLLQTGMLKEANAAPPAPSAPPQVIEAAKRALAKDPNNAQAKSILGIQ